MGSPSRRIALAALLALLAPSVASAQGAGPSAGTPPPSGASGGGSSAAGGDGAGGPGGAAGAADKKPASSGNVGGVTFQDKPTRRAPAARAPLRRGGPIASFPGFEQLPDGGSRLFVQLSQPVPVAERRAQGSITYVLKGAHLRVHNDANSLVTVHFNTPVFRARLVPQGNDLLFVLEMRSAATAAFKVSDNKDKTSTLQIDFPKGDFITGDGNESVPSETRPTRAHGKGPKPAKDTKSVPLPPSDPAPLPDDDGDPGPKP